MLKTVRSYLHSSGQNTETWRTDGQADRQWSSYYSALHWEQCGRAVKGKVRFRKNQRPCTPETGEKMSPNVLIWPLCGLALTLTFDLLTSKSNLCPQLLNLVKFPQSVCKISRSQTSSISSRTNGQPENRTPPAANRQRMHNKMLRYRREHSASDFGTNRTPMRLLIANNTNLHPILHRFQVMADYWSNCC